MTADQLHPKSYSWIPRITTGTKTGTMIVHMTALASRPGLADADVASCSLEAVGVTAVGIATVGTEAGAALRLAAMGVKAVAVVAVLKAPL